MKAGLTDPDAIPDPPDEALTHPGDLWVMRDHRLLCGDSGSATDVDRLLDGQSVHLVNTDPPYNVRVEPRSNNAIAAGLSSFEATTSSNAAEQTKRRAFLMELDPLYCDVIVSRYERFSGRKAGRISGRRATLAIANVSKEKS